MGTAAHAWTLLHDTEEDAFRAQLDSLGTGTTLLVDTYDIAEGVRRAVALGGPGLGGVRIDSGDLPLVAADVRDQLDALGNTSTTITVTSDLDEYAIAALAASPVDSYGVGTSLVTGSGYPTAGLVYKLVARQSASGEWIPVAKKAQGKGSTGGAKQAFRLLENGVATEEHVRLASSDPAPEGSRALVVPFVTDGEFDASHEGASGVRSAREHHMTVRRELPMRALALSKSDPAIPTSLV
jgi:nicotinate phosphoribosyltransferase